MAIGGEDRRPWHCGSTSGAVTRALGAGRWNDVVAPGHLSRWQRWLASGKRLNTMRFVTPSAAHSLHRLLFPRLARTITRGREPSAVERAGAPRRQMPLPAPRENHA